MAVTGVGDLLCQIINADTDIICVPMPGGGEICWHNGVGNIPVPADICSDLMPKVQIGLSALAPVMCIIDVALALIDFAKAVPDSLGPPPDPTALAEALIDLIEKSACLLPLIPQLSICPLIKALLDLIINCLINIREQLVNIVSLKVSVDNGNARSASLGGVALLDAYLDCSSQNIDLLTAALSGSTESMQKLLDVTVNPLMELAGLDPIEFAALDFSAGAPDEVIAALDDTIAALFLVRDALPC